MLGIFSSLLGMLTSPSSSNYGYGSVSNPYGAAPQCGGGGWDQRPWESGSLGYQSQGPFAGPINQVNGLNSLLGSMLFTGPLIGGVVQGFRSLVGGIFGGSPSANVGPALQYGLQGLSQGPGGLGFDTRQLGNVPLSFEGGVPAGQGQFAVLKASAVLGGMALAGFGPGSVAGVTVRQTGEVVASLQGGRNLTFTGVGTDSAAVAQALRNQSMTALGQPNPIIKVIGGSFSYPWSQGLSGAQNGYDGSNTVAGMGHAGDLSPLTRSGQTFGSVTTTSSVPFNTVAAAAAGFASRRSALGVGNHLASGSASDYFASNPASWLDDTA